jgi:hypothetical protein
MLRRRVDYVMLGLRKIRSSKRGKKDGRGQNKRY